MKTPKIMLVLAALFVTGCAAPPAPRVAAEGAKPGPADTTTTALKAQARELRTKITDRKQKIMVFEVMLTDVERRAAIAQVPLTYLPNTDILEEAAAERPANDRLSVAVRSSPQTAMPVAKQPVKKRTVKKKKKTGKLVSHRNRAEPRAMSKTPVVRETRP